MLTMLMEMSLDNDGELRTYRIMFDDQRMDLLLEAKRYRHFAGGETWESVTGLQAPEDDLMPGIQSLVAAAWGDINS